MQNVGTLDRAARAAVSLALAYYALKRSDKAGVVLAFLAGDIFASALSGHCPLYRLLKVNTVGKPI
ncbi:MAG: DUF2892 domain-containing protein [Candidatus Geothermincolales bacterium]